MAPFHNYETCQNDNRSRMAMNIHYIYLSLIPSQVSNICGSLFSVLNEPSTKGTAAVVTAASSVFVCWTFYLQQTNERADLVVTNLNCFFGLWLMDTCAIRFHWDNIKYKILFFPHHPQHCKFGGGTILLIQPNTLQYNVEFYQTDATYVSW